MKTIYKLTAAVLAAMTLLTLGGCGENETDDDRFSYETSLVTDSFESTGISNGFTYSIASRTYVVITGYVGDAAAASIPAEIRGYPVTKIAEQACQNNNVLVSLELPDSITTIGDRAFSHCSSLESITGGNGVKNLGSAVFEGTPFIKQNKEEFLIIGDGILINYGGKDASVTVPDGVKSIVGAFEDCATVTDIILPQSIEVIGNYAFASCTQLQSVNIPDSVTDIGEWAFAKCISLKEIYVPDSVTSLGEMCFMYCSSATSVRLSESITAIPSSVFQSCTSLTEIIIPSSVTSIGDQAFLRCSALASIYVPDSVTSIGMIIFANCSDELTVICSPSSAMATYCNDSGVSHAEAVADA